MIQSIPVKETRDRLADLLNQVEVGGKSFVITKFGKPRAMLVPVVESRKKSDNLKKNLAKTFGIWRNRKDIQDTDTWVRNIRTKMSLRK